MPRHLAPAILLAALAPERADAWGFDGHRIVCGIASEHLTDDATAMVQELLDGVDDTFAESCTWPDEIRPDRPDTAGFHYINVPEGVEGAAPDRDCAEDKRCNPWAVEHFLAVLADGDRSRQERSEALRFVGHFVGDLHQPLHTGRPEDLGGNRVFVRYFGRDTDDRGDRLNLHRVWDVLLLERGGLSWPDSVPPLARVPDDTARDWQQGDAWAWTDASYRLSEELAYGRLPESGHIRRKYHRAALSQAREQLSRAGVRLAWLLNRVAAGEPAFPAHAEAPSNPAPDSAAPAR